MKDLQELAGQTFTKTVSAPQQTQNASAEADKRKKQQNKELHSNSNLSPLARFLVSRLEKVIIHYLIKFILKKKKKIVDSNRLFITALVWWLANKSKGMSMSLSICCELCL